MLLHVLRLAAAALGALLVVVGLLGPISMGQPVWTGIYFIGLGAGIIVITIIGEPRYWPARRAGEGQLRPTDERFIDPTSGAQMRVWIDPATGDRSYLPDGDAPQK